MRLITTIPMRKVKLHIIGTRVICYDADKKDYSLLWDRVIIFDVWNPDSVRRTVGEHIKISKVSRI